MGYHYNYYVNVYMSSYSLHGVRRYFYLVTFVTTPIARLNPVHTKYPMSMQITVTQTPALPLEAAPESGERYGGNSNGGLGAAGGSPKMSDAAKAAAAKAAAALAARAAAGAAGGS